MAGAGLAGEAGDPVQRSDGVERRLLVPADRLGEAAARVEPAAGLNDLQRNASRGAERGICEWCAYVPSQDQAEPVERGNG